MPLQNDFNPAGKSTPDIAARADDDWYGMESAAYPALGLPDDGKTHVVRGMMPLPVADTPGLRGREDLIEAALLVLSQSPTGAALMQRGIDADYHIHLDPPVIGGAGAESEADANGSADHENKRINLRAVDDPYALALTIGHELAHVDQFVTGGLDIHIREDHPVTALKKLLAMEADARAQEMLIAIELAHGRKDDPADRLRFPQMIEKATSGMGIALIAKLMETAAPRLPDDIAVDKVMAGVFKGFYTAPGLRRHYENTILHTLEKQSAQDLQDPANFQGTITAEDLMARIDAALEKRAAATGAVPYLQKNAAGYIDIESPALLSLSQATQDRLDKLAARRHENPATQNDAPWKAAVYTVAKPAESTPAGTAKQGFRP
jgi:hypothetical protein